MQLGPPSCRDDTIMWLIQAFRWCLSVQPTVFFSSLAVTTLVWMKRPFRNSWTQILFSVLSFGGLFLFRVDTKANKLQGSELFPLNKQGILPLCADVQQPYTENTILLSIVSYCSEIHFIFFFFLMGPIFTACIFFFKTVNSVPASKRSCASCLITRFFAFFGIKRRTSCLPDVMR